MSAAAIVAVATLVAVVATLVAAVATLVAAVAKLVESHTRKMANFYRMLGTLSGADPIPAQSDALQHVLMRVIVTSRTPLLPRLKIVKAAGCSHGKCRSVLACV